MNLRNWRNTAFEEGEFSTLGLAPNSTFRAYSPAISSQSASPQPKEKITRDHNCPAINRLNVDGWESPSLSIAIFRQEILSFPQVFCQPTRYLT